MTPDVTNPRQLAPTVGPAVKSVTFRAGSMKGAEDLVVGRIITVNGTPLIDESRWGPEADYLETGHVILFGSINVFVGFIGGRSIRSVQEGDPIEEVADDGEESVESMDSQELGSIIPAFEESCWGYPPEITSSPDQEIAQVAVYMAGGAGASGTAGETEASAPPSNPLLVPVSATNAALRATEIEAARAELLYEVRRMEEERRRLDRINQGIQQERQRVAALAVTQQQVDPQTQLRATQPTVEIPLTPAAGTGIQTIAEGRVPTNQETQQQPRRFHTPQGHYQNPVDNMYAAANILTQMVPTGDDPVNAEARRAIQMLSTAVLQQANRAEAEAQLPLVPANHRIAAERSVQSRPPENISGVAQRQQEQVADAQANMPVVQTRPADNPGGAPTALSSRLKGPACFTERIRSEPFPEDFKGPRKVANYNASMDPTTWLNNYEMGMSILNASEEICARYLNMMLEGAAHIWLQNLPPNSINTWEELKDAFIKNFQGTCKRLCNIEDLERCVQKEGESSRHWMKRVAEIIHSSDNIPPSSAILVMEKNCKFEPLIHKLGRMKDKVKSLSEVMAAANKYASSDKTRDASDGEEEEVAAKGKKNSNKP